MLPKQGSSERNLLNTEALLKGEQLLEEHGEIPLALYYTRMHFKAKFLAERDLMDTVPDTIQEQEEWGDVLTDAIAIQEYVDHTWATRILE